MARSVTKIAEVTATSGDRLEVALGHGGMKVEGWQRNLVSVTCPRGLEAGRDVRVERFPDGVRVTTGEHPDGDLPAYHYLLIKVPFRYHCDLRTNSGGLAVETIAGNVFGRTWEGDLSFQRVAGKVDLATAAGAVRLRDCAVTGQVKTHAGNIRMLKVNSATAASGHDSQAPGGELRLRSFSGNINVEEVLGKTDLSTFSGTIRVGSVKGSLKATSNNGKVLVRELQGSAALTTCHGSVRLKKVHAEPGVRRELDIDANGRVSLSLVTPASLELDVELTRTHGKWRRCRIVSDFDLEQQRLPGWDLSRGTPRRSIEARGTLGDGDSRLRIRARNHDVVLRTLRYNESSRPAA